MDRAGSTQRVSTGTTNRAEAEQFLRDFIAGRNAPPPPDRITIADAVRYYLDNLPPQKAKRQDWNLRSILRHLGTLRVDEITRPVCRNYQDRRRTEKPMLSQSTLRDELTSLRTALLCCERDKIIDRAPWIEAPPPAAPRERWLSVEEIDRLLATCLATPHLWLFVVLALHTGARSGAILELTWDRVDMDARRIEYNVPGRTRTKKGRATVPMSDAVHTALSLTPVEARSGHVIRWAGRRVSSVKKAFAAACRKADLVEVTPHTLRHTFATHAAMKGVDMRRISKFLGHDDERTTASVYAKYSPDYLANVVPFGALFQTPGTSSEQLDNKCQPETKGETSLCPKELRK